MCFHASFNFPAFALVFGPDEWPRFQSLYHKLAKFNDPRIKKTLAASIHELAMILGPKYTEQDLLPCMEKFLKDKQMDIKVLALKNMHIFLKEISPEKRSGFIKYIVQTFEEAGKTEWRQKQILAQNIGNYAELFDAGTVYQEFLPMFFKFCSDNFAKVSVSSCSALAGILSKFNDDEAKQTGIVRVVKKRYLKARTFKKRQQYIMMCQGKLMMNKDIFEKHFKVDFLSLIDDKVPNVRIALAKALRHHFVKEISGVFVEDEEFNDAIKVLKKDSCEDVRELVRDIELFVVDKGEVNFETFIESLRQSMVSDTDSINSEDEMKLENEIRRHNSEDEIDHGPVLASLREARQKEL